MIARDGDALAAELTALANWLDGLHFDGTCPRCGAGWAIRLATGR